MQIEFVDWYNFVQLFISCFLFPGAPKDWCWHYMSKFELTERKNVSVMWRTELSALKKKILTREIL